MMVYMDPILIFSLSLPIAAVILTAFLNKRASLYTAVISFMPLIAYSLYGIFANLDYLVPLGSLPSPIGGMYLINDGLSNSFGFTIALVTAMISIVSEPYMEHRFRALGIKEEFNIYYPLFILCGISMEWIVYAYNLLLMYIGLEVSLISSFLLIYFYGYDGYGRTRQWIGLLYFVYTHVASVLFLVGAIIVALTNGTMNLAAIKYVPPVAWVLILIGMLIKLPSYGPHVWLPWAHGMHPTPVAALIISVVGLASYILARIYLISPYFITSIRTPLLAYAIIGGILVSFAVFRQRHSYKWLLAYSTVANMAYLLAGLTLGTYGIVGLTLHFIAHQLGKAVLFMTAGAIIVQYDILDMSKMGGLQNYIPSIGGAALLGWMSLAGIFTVGLLGEFFLFLGLLTTLGFSLSTLWAFVGLAFLFLLTGTYGFWALKEVFYGQPRWPYTKTKPSNKLVVPLYVLGLTSVILLFPPISTALVHSVLSAIGVIMHV
ncbi:complex I subunit 5 family protein [Caldivirga maquilingensis]|uniref:NADH/Ubiquinone/plastoquinone (Complex I) n=1 Tax=Caldivirga maquilingensis (strain ATCC 700844 / DSM 13496 / JCM 10307 / IC-167) TaxID=397948 RepID=A8M8N9_CALMQ|nr:complex I subunit 5 family protein [Caldivirga maquilingensis]ABW02108.1 NADH/Ubiquinone/plastoquinone (complex I) [Caldivirga maquilingensis IC-167]